MTSPGDQFKGEISATDLLALKPDVLDALKQSIVFKISLEPDPDGNGNTITAVPIIHDKWTDGLKLGDIQDTPGLEKYLEQTNEREPISMQSASEINTISLLIKMADKFDQEGNHNLAQEVDSVLETFAARPRAPLKQLDDDIKKNLIIFVHDADLNNAKSIRGLNELFRRLRYFDFADSARELGLDKVVKEMEKTQGGLSEAKKRFYELMHGKKPSRKDLEDLFKEVAEEVEEQSALDFFDQHADDEYVSSPEPELEDECDEIDKKEETEEELSKEMEAELEKFLSELEDNEGEE